MTVETNIQWEVTDTYAGEANYSWVKRGKIETKNKEFSNLSAIRKVKKEIGWNGVRCKTSDFGILSKFALMEFVKFVSLRFTTSALLAN